MLKGSPSRIWRTPRGNIENCQCRPPGAFCDSGKSVRRRKLGRTPRWASKFPQNDAVQGASLAGRAQTTALLASHRGCLLETQVIFYRNDFTAIPCMHAAAISMDRSFAATHEALCGVGLAGGGGTHIYSGRGDRVPNLRALF